MHVIRRVAKDLERGLAEGRRASLQANPQPCGNLLRCMAGLGLSADCFALLTGAVAVAAIRRDEVLA